MPTLNDWWGALVLVWTVLGAGVWLGFVALLAYATYKTYKPR